MGAPAGGTSGGRREEADRALAPDHHTDEAARDADAKPLHDQPESGERYPEAGTDPPAGSSEQGHHSEAEEQRVREAFVHRTLEARVPGPARVTDEG